MGDNDQAAYWLEKGLDEGSLWLNDLTVHIPKLRSNPKFDSILRGTNLK